MVWKVKRRPDGSRYIVRRPAQGSRVLRSREMKSGTQQCAANELTTEDDTMSEIKLGRYWNKDERKKHMERAKERRQRQEQVLENVKLMHRKNMINVGAAVDEGTIIGGGGGNSSAKVAKGEQPSGGAGIAEGAKDNKIDGLLSVTTV